MSLTFTTLATPPTITSYNSLVSANTTASAAACSGAATVTTTANVVDVMVKLMIVTPSFTPVAASGITIYIAGSEDGTTWPGAAATTEVLGSDATVTLSTLGNNLRYLGWLQCHTSGGTFTSEPLSVAQAFGGVLPRKWCIVIVNQLPAGASLAASGHALTATEVSYS
jgi:hypothetical protein